MPPASLLDVAIQVAVTAHAGQVDKSGVPYIFHPLRVMETVRRGGGDEIILAIAVMHDVIEDTAVTLDGLRPRLHAATGAEIAEEVLRGLDAVTKRPGESREAYVQRIIEGGMVVLKFADIEDNLGRLHFLEDADQSRLMAKYARDMDQMVAAFPGTTMVLPG